MFARIVMLSIILQVMALVMTPNSFAEPVVPGAPTNVTAVAGNTEATISFTAPASNGGAAITGYTVTSNPGGLTGSGAASPITVTGLSNGTTYTFTVTATNSAGTGAASPASNSVTLRAIQMITFNNPGAQNFGTTPTLTATADSGLTVHFSSSTPGVATITSGGVLTFITAGTATINANQPGNASYLPATEVSRSFTVNPVAPGAPTAVTADAGDTEATISFTAPASNGGAAITGYTVTSNPEGLTAIGTASPITVMGLTNGQAYTFTVTATNMAGTGAASFASNSVAPRLIQMITFNNPGAQNFGTTPTLTATSTSGLPVYFSSSTPAVATITSGGALTFLTAGTATIHANQAGNASYLPAAEVSRSFAVNAVVPGAPTAVTAFAGDTEAIISFTAPASNGGSAITGYTVTSNPGGLTASGTASPVTVTGLTNDTAYTFTVAATNGAGTGAASPASNSVTPIHIVTDSERVDHDYDALVIGYSGTDTSVGVTRNITLLEAGNNGTSIVWHSNNPEIISARGVVTRPTGANVQVILTATLTKNDATRTKSFTVTVLKQPSNSGNTGGTGGSEDSSSDSSQPTQTSAPAFNEASKIAGVIVNGEAMNVGTQTVTKVDGKTEMTLVLHTEEMFKLVEAATKENQGSNEVVVPVGKLEDVIKVILSGETVKELEKNHFMLSVKEETIEYRLDVKALTVDQVAALLGVKTESLKDIEIEVTFTKLSMEEKEALKNELQAQGHELIFEPVAFNISARTTNQEGEVEEVTLNRFSTYVERIMEIPAEIDPNKVTTGIVINSDGSYAHVPTEVFEKEGKWYAKLQSLTNSAYSAIWNLVEVHSVQDHWSKEHVNDMAARLVLLDHESFLPDKAVTRAEFAAYMVRALGLYREGLPVVNKFTDIAANKDYSSILIANEWKIIQGYPDGAFKPDATITREEAMVMYSKAMDLVKIQENKAGRLAAYTDAYSVSNWAAVHVGRVLDADIFKGRQNGTLDPKGTLTHAESLTAIRNLLVEAALINH
ncbi:fibronectin type III domain-containing protein [Anoxynatronum sibiricum]|uniref:Fibronectin type III domain-containing protein n=2 Tax=Anoxynatronum sibiricum TaxID=210623 RepID=A0ABU9VVI1_9CLOT